MHKDWYSPGQIHFRIDEALWLIQHLAMLEVGPWPPEASNYVDIQGRRRGKHKAPFETPADYYAEITARLERCGTDGLILEAIEAWGKTVPSLASYFQIPEWSVRKRRKNALGYVASGPARRWHNTEKRVGELYEPYTERRH